MPSRALNDRINSYLSRMETPRVILVGTDSKNPSGGIATAMSGYRAALESERLLHSFITSHDPRALGGKWWVALKAAPKMIRAIMSLRRSGVTPIVYAHAGAWPSLVRKRFLLSLAHLSGARTMLQIHSPTVDGYLEHRLGRILFGGGLAGVDLLCTLTPWWKERLWSAGVRNALAVVPNPLPPDLESIALRPDTAFDFPSDKSGDLRILTMTRLVSGKGVDIAIEAMVHLPESFHCTIAGDGPERPRLEALAQRRNLGGRIKFAGWASGEVKHELLDSADIFCLPSTRDSFGMGYVEAMAYGVPVVAVRSRGIPDVVVDGGTGLLVNDPDPLQVAGAVRTLANPNIRRRMGAQGKSRVIEQFGRVRVGRILRELVLTVE